jgi:hypothetical protein
VFPGEGWRYNFAGAEWGPGRKSLKPLRAIGSNPLRSISAEILQIEETGAMTATIWAAEPYAGRAKVCVQ